MLTQTSELATRTLIFLALEGDERPLPPRQIAERIECSASYLAKTLRMLVGARILRSVRGAHGGVLLARAPETITLLDIVQACQGLLIGNYCQAIEGHTGILCSYHQAMAELFRVTTETLAKWTLKDLLECPASPRGEPACLMAFRGSGQYTGTERN